MSHSDYRRLIDHGRKSGLTTSELYRALSGRPAMASDFSAGPADGNGFVPALDSQGHPVFRPQDPKAQK